MTKLTDLLLCDAKVHCQMCRDKIHGGLFRLSVAQHTDVGTTEYECPLGMPWVETADSRAVAMNIVEHVPPLDLPKLVSEIATDTEADRWIKAIISQIQDEKRRHEEKNEPCKAMRGVEKMKDRWEEYLAMKEGKWEEYLAKKKALNTSQF